MGKKTGIFSMLLLAATVSFADMPKSGVMNQQDEDALAKKYGGVLVEQPTAPKWDAGMSQKLQDENMVKDYERSQKLQDEKNVKDYDRDQKRLQDLRQIVDQSGTLMNDLNRFGRLNRDNATGSVWNNITPEWQAFRSPGSMHMASIQARIALKERTLNSGSTLNLDVSLFLKGLPSISNYGNTNREIRFDYGRQHKKAVEKLNAMEAHLKANGNLLSFDTQWERSQNAADTWADLKPGETMHKSKPPAKDFQNHTLTSKDGKKYRSDGMNWNEVK